MPVERVLSEASGALPSGAYSRPNGVLESARLGAGARRRAACVTKAPWYPKYVGDYARDTSHLSQGESGAYNELLDWQYANRKPLPSEKALQWRVGKGTSPGSRKNVDTVIAQFFVDDGDGLWNPRAKAEIEQQIARETKLSTSGKKGARKRWGGHKGGDKPGHKPPHVENDGSRARDPQPQVKKTPGLPGLATGDSPPARTRERARDGWSPQERAEMETAQAELERRRAAEGIGEPPGPRPVADVLEMKPGNPEPGNPED